MLLLFPFKLSILSKCFAYTAIVETKMQKPPTIFSLLCDDTVVAAATALIWNYFLKWSHPHSCFGFFCKCWYYYRFIFIGILLPQFLFIFSGMIFFYTIPSIHKHFLLFLFVLDFVNVSSANQWTVYVLLQRTYK